VDLMRAIRPKSAFRHLFKSSLGRDVTLALLFKLVLLTGLIVLVSRLAVPPADTAAATAAAVAGIGSGPGVIVR
jgi:hypothetical protein